MQLLTIDLWDFVILQTREFPSHWTLLNRSLITSDNDRQWLYWWKWNCTLALERIAYHRESLSPVTLTARCLALVRGKSVVNIIMRFFAFLLEEVMKVLIKFQDIVDLECSPWLVIRVDWLGWRLKDIIFKFAAKTLWVRTQKSEKFHDDTVMVSLYSGLETRRMCLADLCRFTISSTDD